MCPGVTTDSLALERVLFGRRALVQPLPSALQMANRQKGAHFLSDLVVAHALPPHISGFTLQILDLIHIWSGSDSDVLELDDILGLAAAVYVFIKRNLSSLQRYPRTLSELLTAVAELLTRQQPDDVPVLHYAGTVQQVTHIEVWVLKQLEFELATLTPMACFDVFIWRHSLWQQLQQQRQSQNNSHTQPRPTVPSEFLAVFANHVAAAHVQSFSFCFLSTASQVGATAWFVSVLLWVLLNAFAVQ